MENETQNIINVLISQRDMAMNNWAENAASLATAKQEIKKLLDKIVELESKIPKDA